MLESYTTRLCTKHDVGAIARIRYDAFAVEPMDELTMLLGSEPDPVLNRVRTRDEVIHSSLQDISTAIDSCTFVVGVFSPTSALAGVAFWQHITPSTPSTVPETDAKEQQHPSLTNRFYAKMNRTRNALMQAETYWFLKLLIIDPPYQRKGLGKILLNWGLDRAKIEASRAYLESSPMGKSLYERCGFKVVQIDRLDEQRARKGYVEWPVMLWDSKE